MAASKFTEEVRVGILARVSAGASIPDAARAGDVDPSTVKRWLARGRRDQTGDYSEFATAVSDARRRHAELPPPMSADEFRQRLDAAVRAGSVSAMKLWSAVYLEPEKEEYGDLGF